MKTMPRFTLRVMRFSLERMLTRLSRWEDKHADERDYRMTHLNTGLWQASQSIREILDGEFTPGLHEQPYESGLPVGKAWMPDPEDSKAGHHYAAELFQNVPIPVALVD